MNQPAEVDKGQYWICLSCLRINHHSTHHCEDCQSHQPAFAEMLTLEDARDQADIIRVDALLARAKETLKANKNHRPRREKPAGELSNREKTRPVKRRSASMESTPAEPTPGTQAEAGGITTSVATGVSENEAQPPRSASDEKTKPSPRLRQAQPADPPELIPVTPWWPKAGDLMQMELAGVFQKAQTDGRRFPAVASWIPNSAEKTRERKQPAQSRGWYYAVAVVATVLLIVAGIQWLFTPNYKLVQVQGLFWSVDIPIERAVTIAIKEDGSKGSTSAEGPILTKWVLMRTLHEEGKTKDVVAPEVTLPDERFRAGEPEWIFRVDLVDQQGFVYPEYFPQERWMQFEPGQTYRATLKNGVIVQLDPLP